MADSDTTSPQPITRLTPLGSVLALIEARAGAVKPQKRELAQAQGCTLAEDVVVEKLPRSSIALRDGFAVEAAAVADASSYAPAPLASKPRRIDVGETMPDNADAVLPHDAVTLRGDHAEAIGAVTAGEGVLPAGGDAGPCAPLRRAGERLRGIDIAVMRAVGIAEVTIRAPRISIVHGAAPGTPLIEAACTMLARVVVDAGGVVFGKARVLIASLDYEQPDAVIAVGGTGSGQRDDSVLTLARYGRVEAHGIAVSPGETAAFGFVGTRAVLLVPGRLDMALALWLLIGRHLIAKLAGGSVSDMPVMLPLKRKVTSTIGLSEVIPVKCAGGMAEPLASGYLSFTVLARSDGWIVIPADSEGFAAGTPVAIYPWP
jgi:molybdopterin molybdotransferase